MKFTKEEAVEKLNQKLTNGGKKPLRMSARTLEGQTETLLNLIANDETELDDFVEKIIPSLEAINSNMEHDMSEFIKKQTPTPTPAPKPNPTPGPEDALAKALERLSILEEKEASRGREAAIETKRKEIREYLSKNGVKNKEWVDMALGMVTLKEDVEVEGSAKEILALYNKSLAGGEPFVPGQPTPGGAGAPNYDDVKAIIKRNSGVQK